MTGDERFLRARMVAVEVLCVGAILALLAVCIASGLVHASLWMDEITYHYMEDDFALRAAELGRPGGTRDVSVVCQHVVTGGFPLPAQAIGLDFYLNVLHPGEPAIPIHELPDLSLINGRRGVYDLFAGGSPVLDHYLASTPDVWRAKRDSLRPTLFVLRQIWNIEAGARQGADFAHVVLERGDRVVTRQLFVPGFPRSMLVEVHMRPAP